MHLYNQRINEKEKLSDVDNLVNYCLNHNIEGVYLFEVDLDISDEMKSLKGYYLVTLPIASKRLSINPELFHTRFQKSKYFNQLQKMDGSPTGIKFLRVDKNKAVTGPLKESNSNLYEKIQRDLNWIKQQYPDPHIRIYTRRDWGILPEEFFVYNETQSKRKCGKFTEKPNKKIKTDDQIQYIKKEYDDEFLESIDNITITLEFSDGQKQAMTFTELIKIKTILNNSI